jgi:hypothetical protein
VLSLGMRDRLTEPLADRAIEVMDDCARKIDRIRTARRSRRADLHGSER